MSAIPMRRVYALCCEAWGKGAGCYRAKKAKVRTPEERVAALEQLKLHQAVKPKASSFDRATDEAWAAYRARRNEWQRRYDELFGVALCPPYRVGRTDTVLGLFFEVMGEGDSWREALGKAAKRNEAMADVLRKHRIEVPA